MRQLCTRAYRAICAAVGNHKMADKSGDTLAPGWRVCEMLEGRVLLSSATPTSQWPLPSPASLAEDPVMWAEGTAAVSNLAQQTTAGPTSGQTAASGGLVQGGVTGIHTISGVPAYLWHDGCGPTATGMIMGYWDGKGFGNLIPGDASTQTQAVNDAITSPEHYRDYALPMDEYSLTVIPDKSSTGGAHANNSLGDWMRTSWSAAGNQYGWSWLSDVPGAMTGYASYMGYNGSSTSIVAYSQTAWNTITSEIDAGRPMGFIVDSDGDGSTDHFIAVIGYGMDNGVPAYDCFNTWDSSQHWYDYRAMSSSYTFGVYSAVLFNPGTSVEPTIDSLSASPTNVTLGQNVTLTARNVTQAGGTVSGVGFYLESNDTPGLQTGTNGDTWVASGVRSGTDWSASVSTASLTSAGLQTYYALATGSSGNTTPMGTSAPTATVTVVELGTTMTLDASASTSVFGQQVTFTANVTASIGTPGGTVDFYDGTTLLASASLDAKGTAVFTVNTLSAGNHSITAIYEGNAGFFTSDTLDAPLPLTITPAPLTVTGLTASDKVYDGTTTVTFSTTNTVLVGLVSGHTVTLNTKAITLGFADKNVGVSKVLVLKNLLISGSDVSNYTLIQPVVTASITARPISISANALSKTYGSADPTLTYRFTSGTLATGERLTGTLSRVSGEHVGSYQVSQGSLTAGTNYNLTFTGAALTISRATLHIVADNQTKAYGADLPTLTATYVGLVGGDTPASLTVQPTLSTTATALSPVSVNPYNITVSGAVDSDYTISYVTGYLTVTPAATTTDLSSSNASARPGEAVSFTATVTQPVAGSLSGTVQFQIDGASVVSLALAAGNTATYTTSTLPVGSHSVVAVYSGGGSFAGSTSASLAQSVSRVMPTITWPTPAAITYGASVGTAQLDAVATDPSTGATVAGTFGYGVTASTILHAGTRQLSVTFTPTDTAHYDPATASVELVVNKAILTSTADNKTRAYGAGNPALTFSPFAGLVNGDLPAVVSGAPSLTTGADATTVPGTYPISITQDTLAADDYAFNLIAGDLIVTKATTTTAVTTNNATAVSGQSITFTATVTPTSGTAPTGTVQFQIDGTNVGSPIALSDGTASYTTSRLLVAKHKVVAIYSGDGNFSTSTSVALKQNVAVDLAPTGLTLSKARIAENQLGGSVVGVLTAIDPNVGDTFTYRLVAGTGATDNASFAIEGNQLKTSKTAASFNYEARTSYSIRVRVIDQANVSFDQVFTISVTNVNEAPTNVKLSAATIAENQPSGTLVGTLKAVDQDAASTFTYLLVDGAGSTDNASFKLIGNQLVSAQRFDYEAKSSYSIRVRVTDQGGLSFEKALTIQITNVNEAPTDISPDVVYTVLEQQLPGTLVGALKGIDPDATSVLTYTLVPGTGSTDNALFTIVGAKLKTAKSLSYATAAVRKIRVRVTDQYGLWYEKALLINVVQI